MYNSIMNVKVINKYKDWSPLPHSIIKSAPMREEINHSGFKLVNCLNQTQLQKLTDIFEEEHDFDVNDGGMFYSMYSKDKDYRSRVHLKIKGVLEPVLDQYFTDYKNVINAFVVKLPGERSEFYLHQDTTVLDEFEYSPLSLWIPLHDITDNNGALSIVPKSHWFFSPYRAVTLPFPFKEIAGTVRKYLKPIFMRAGEVLFFDNRVIHNSALNNSGEPRIAIICGLFPKNAPFRTIYNEPVKQEKSLSIFEHDENFLLEYEQFFYDCTSRPETGTLVDQVDNDFPDMTESQFEELCEINGIVKIQAVENVENSTANCDLIAEPDGINKFEEVEVEVEKEAVMTGKVKNSWLARLLKKRLN